jgi:CPA1 family monovalent cation:H+ antiporter
VRQNLELRLPKRIRQIGRLHTTASQVGPENSEALRKIADADYRLQQHLGFKEGLIILWAGMRGAVTLAAALTLPRDFPNRPLLVLLASVFATGTLLIQGFTLPILLKKLDLTNHRRYEPSHFRALRAILRDASNNLLANPTLVTESGEPYADEVVAEERENLLHDPSLVFIEEQNPSDTSNQQTQPNSNSPTSEMPETPGDWSRLRQYLELRRRVFKHQHDTLLEVRSLGIHDSEAVSRMFDTLDAEQMAVELRLATIDLAQ